MSIIIKVEPQILQPCYNPIITVLDSTNKGKENYQFIIDVNIDGSAQSRMKIQPSPSGFGTLDLHKHIEPYVSYDYTNTLTDLTEVVKATNSFTEYDITLSEEYIPTIDIVDIVNNGSGTVQVTTTTAHGAAVGNSIKILNCDVSAYDGTYVVLTTGTSVTFTVTATYTGTDGTSGEYRLSSEVTTTFTSSTVFSGTKIAWNGVEDWVDFSTYLKDDYDLVDGDARLLTSLTSYEDWNSPTSGLTWANAFEVTSNSRMYLNGFDSNESFNYTQITSFDSNGNYINDVDSNAVESGTTDNFIIRSAVGPWNINNSGSGSGYGSNFLTGATYYTVQVQTDELSKKYMFKIVDDCTKYETFQFLFLDRLGSLIPVTFNLMSKENVNVSKTSYKKNSGTYNSTTNTWGYNSYDRGKTRLGTQVDRVITVNSDWVSESQSNVINEMFASPEVYHIDEDGNSYAIDILTSRYDVKTRLNDKIINHTFEFEYSFKDKQQL